jgi:GT2 family glycosyltransferase
MATRPNLTIIILNYNTAEWVTQCLESLKKNVVNTSRYDIDVVVVDNASTDDSPQVLKKHFPWVTLIETGKNLGFAGGNNVALRQVHTKYVMLLNSDTTCTAETNFDALIEYLEEHPQVGVITPRLELANGELDMASHRGEPTPWASLTYFSTLAKLFPQSELFAQYHQTYQDFSAVHQIDACSGAAMVIRTAAMEKAGLLDEQFFMYAEDLDWCKRFREAGYQIIYYPHAKIIHHKYKSGLGKSDISVAKKTNVHFYETMLQYYDKHYRQQYPFVYRWLLKLFISFKKGGV